MCFPLEYYYCLLGLVVTAQVRFTIGFISGAVYREPSSQLPGQTSEHQTHNDQLILGYT